MEGYVIKQCSLLSGELIETFEESYQRDPWDAMQAIDRMLSRSGPDDVVVVYRPVTEEDR